MSCLKWEKNELPRVGLELTTLYTLPLSYHAGSTAGWAKISHLIVHLDKQAYCQLSMKEKAGVIINETTKDTKHQTEYIHVLMRDEKEGREKQARSNKQQGKATQHTQDSHFSQGKMSCLGWNSNPRHSTL